MGFELGPLFVRYYGMILMFGVLAATFLVDREARRRGADTEIVWDGLVWVLIGGVVGARLWHVFLPAASDVAKGLTTRFYLTHPLDALAIWKGGLGVPGAVIGGVLMLYLFARRRQVDFLFWTDIAAPGLALGQAIGRWGNFVNQELYGMPSDLPWAIRIDPQFRLPGYETVATYHPLFLYESLWNLANMALLLWMMRRFEDRLGPGDVFLTYLIVYPIGRFLLEFLRLDTAQVSGINFNQAAMGLVAVVSAGVLIWRFRQRGSAEKSPRRRRKRST